MPDYWGGLVEGFQGRREKAYQENYERELQNRQMADKVFDYLLKSRDPQMQQLALSGMMNPLSRKKGFRGFLGEVESNPFLAQVVSRMNEEIPEEQPVGAPPASPGSAAMSTNVPVQAGSEPIPRYEEAPGPLGGGGMEAVPPGPPPLGPEMGGPMAGPPGMPGPPPESKFKRRGTGVPTAEEIAEANAQAQLQGRIKAAVTGLTQAGATREEIESAIMGLSGAPRPARRLTQVSGWGVKIPGSDIVQPVLLDENVGGYVLAGGQALPQGSQMVRMSGAASGGGALTSTVEDSSETRQQLIALGADPAVIARGTGTGYWRMRQDLAGNVLVQPGEYTPPPAFSGTTEITAPTNPRIPIRGGIQRGGGGVTPLGDIDQPVKSQLQLDAEALRTAVDDEVKLRLTGVQGRLKGVKPADRDQIVRLKAQAMGLPYRTYDEVIRAAGATTPIATREREEGGSTAERVLRRAMQQRQEEQQARPPVKPPPPSRARGAGPGPVR